MRKICHVVITVLCCMCAVTALAGYRPNAIRPKDSIVVILTYGLPLRADRSAIVDKVAARYGFQYLSVGGCMVSQEISCCTQRLNSITYEYLAKRNGADWEKRYDREVDSMFTLYDSAIAIVCRSPVVTSYLKQHKDMTDESWLYLVNFRSNGVCEVDVHDGLMANEHQLLTRFRVYIKDKRVQQLYSKAEICRQSHW